MVDIRDLYFKYLCSLIAIPKKKFSKLLAKLYDKPFKWYIPHDDNRIADAVIMREDYIHDVLHNEELGIKLREYDVSMLELMISLAYRCESMAIDQEKPMKEWFWILVNNLALYEYWDSNYKKLGGDTEVDRILDVVIERTYARNGRGGLFPLTPTSENIEIDQRKEELWYQMSAYLIENYYSKSVTV